MSNGNFQIFGFGDETLDPLGLQISNLEDIANKHRIYVLTHTHLVQIYILITKFDIDTYTLRAYLYIYL